MKKRRQKTDAIEAGNPRPDGSFNKRGKLFECIIVSLCVISGVTYFVTSHGVRNFLLFLLDAIDKAKSLLLS